MLGFNDTSTLGVILCHPEKERREIEEIVDEMKGRDRGEGGKWMKLKKQKKLKHSSSTCTCCNGSRPSPAVSQYELDTPVMQDTGHLCLTQPSPNFLSKSRVCNSNNNNSIRVLWPSCTWSIYRYILTTVQVSNHYLENCRRICGDTNRTIVTDRHTDVWQRVKLHVLLHFMAGA